MYILNQQSLLSKLQIEELEKICMEALKIKYEFIDLYYYLGISQAFLGKNIEQ